KDETLISEMRAIQEKFGGKRKDDRLGQRRTQFAIVPDIAEEAAAIENYVEREPITVVCSEKGWLRSLKGHQEPGDAIKYREGDRDRFWLHAETTDKLMMLSTDGRFFTLDCAKLPGGRGNGEAIRSFIDLPPEADLVEVFVHKPERKLLLAADTGDGFVTNEDEAVAVTCGGQRVVNVGAGALAAACTFVDGDAVGVLG